MQWSEAEGDYVTDRKRYASTIRDIESQLDDRRSRFAAEQRRQLRAHVCGSLAGPAADAIHSGEDVSDALDFWSVGPEEGEDLTVAAGMARLLPFRNEYDHAVRQTEDLLRRPAVWEYVVRLADELEQAGDLDDFDHLLPKRIAGWPSSPRSKSISVSRIHNFGNHGNGEVMDTEAVARWTQAGDPPR